VPGEDEKGRWNADRRDRQVCATAAAGAGNSEEISMGVEKGEKLERYRPCSVVQGFQAEEAEAFA
jgi:hypothetical protein